MLELVLQLLRPLQKMPLEVQAMRLVRLLSLYFSYSNPFIRSVVNSTTFMSTILLDVDDMIMTFR